MFPRKHIFHSLLSIGLFLAAAVLFSGCAPAGSPTELFLPTPGLTWVGQLTPYASPSAWAIGTKNASMAAPARLSTSTLLPSPSPTPRTHIVKKGEDLGGIAWQYRVSLEALMAANPTVRPNQMSVGTALVIPASKTPLPVDALPPGGVNLPADPSTPTAIPIVMGQLACTRVVDGGVWCFLPVRNNQSYSLESVSALFHLADQQAKTTISQIAFTPLDILPPGVTLPLAAYFSPEQVAPLIPPYLSSSDLLTALPSPKDGRYLPARLENKKVLLSENGLSADVSVDVILDSSGKANRVWVAATAYDQAGEIIGIRRWEKKDSHPLEAKQALPVSMRIYSVSAIIDRVELVAEIRP